MRTASNNDKNHEGLATTKSARCSSERMSLAAWLTSCRAPF